MQSLTIANRVHPRGRPCGLIRFDFPDPSKRILRARRKHRRFVGTEVLLFYIACVLTDSLPERETLLHNSFFRDLYHTSLLFALVAHDYFYRSPFITIPQHVRVWWYCRVNSKAVFLCAYKNTSRCNSRHRLRVTCLLRERAMRSFFLLVVIESWSSEFIPTSQSYPFLP